MGAIFEIEARITERGQTTVPSAIRKALGVDRNDKIMFRQMDDGSVVIVPAPGDRDAADPVITSFLAFLEGDMASNPKSLVPLTQQLVDRGKALIDDVDVDLDVPLQDG